MDYGSHQQAEAKTMSDTKEREKQELSLEIIALGAMKAVLATDGVAEMSESASVPQFIRKTGSAKGVKITQHEDGLELDLSLNVKFGASIPTVAWNIQENVKNKLQALTDFEIVKVDVHITGVAG